MLIEGERAGVTGHVSGMERGGVSTRQESSWKMVRPARSKSHPSAPSAPCLDLRPRHHLARVDFPLVGLKVRIVQDAVEHSRVDVRGPAREVGHQVDVNLEEEEVGKVRV